MWTEPDADEETTEPKGSVYLPKIKNNEAPHKSFFKVKVESGFFNKNIFFFIYNFF